MRFGHLEDGRLVLARLPLVIGDAECFTLDRDIMLSAGEKEIVSADEPEARLDGRYISRYTESDELITEVREFIPYTEEEKKRLYKLRVNSYIRQRYSSCDEAKLVRELIAYEGEDNAAEFSAYNEYVEACKARAKEEIYGTDCA